MNLICPSNKGITLIELMVVIAIISVISAIAVPAYNGYIKTSRKGECINEVATIQLIEEDYFLTNNSYFAGATTAILANASDNFYAPSPTFTLGTANCTIAVTAGPNGIATQYQITATGILKLQGEGIVVQNQNY